MGALRSRGSSLRPARGFSHTSTLTTEPEPLLLVNTEARAASPAVAVARALERPSAGVAQRPSLGEAASRAVASLLRLVQGTSGWRVRGRSGRGYPRYEGCCGASQGDPDQLQGTFSGDVFPTQLPCQVV